jgi:hypothetical protein
MPPRKTVRLTPDLAEDRRPAGPALPLSPSQVFPVPERASARMNSPRRGEMDDVTPKP